MTDLQLPLRKLGQTGMEVSCLGLGTVKFGRNQGVKYPSGFELPDDEDVRQILHLSRELGINLIDTAPAYGRSEERLGQLLENRQDWLICSKAGEEFDEGVSSHNFSASHMRASIERSLRRLRTDYLDMVLVHSDGNDLQIIEQSDCLEALERCRSEGLIRSFGMSTKTVAGGLAAAERTDLVMVTYNPLETAEQEVIDRAHALNKGVLVKKALNSGHLRGDSHADPVRSNMEFIFKRPGVSAIIIGTINPLHIRHNVQLACSVLGS